MPQRLEVGKLAHIQGDDICHSREGREAGSDLGVEAGILDLLGLRHTSRHHQQSSTLRPWSGTGEARTTMVTTYMS